MKLSLIPMVICLILTYKFQNANLDEIISTERAFSDYAKLTTTKQAFLKFMAPNGIKFREGEARNAISLFEELPDAESKDLLQWWPVFADISSSHDFGYTYGPWQYFAIKTDTIPTSTGMYSSVWQKQNNGEWKNLVDLGVAFRHNFTVSSKVDSPGRPLKTTRSGINISEEKKDLLLWDNKYSIELNQLSVSCISDFFDFNGRLHRPGELPITGRAAIKSYNDGGKKFVFNTLDVEMAKAADMAHTYGKVAVSLPNGRIINANYIRIWRKEDGESWKIVLDVIGVS